MSIDVWFIPSNADDAAVAHFESLLTADEKARANRFRFDADRRRSIVTRGALRERLASYTSGEVEIVDAGREKPRLRGGEIEFNVSHSGDLIVLAFAASPIGVDIERVRPLGADADLIARDQFSPAEYERVAQAADRDSAFFDIWTAKEAVVKAAGDGLSAALRAFTVPAASEGFQPVGDLERWSVCAIAAPHGGYRAAVAIGSDRSECVVRVCNRSSRVFW